MEHRERGIRGVVYLLVAYMRMRIVREMRRRYQHQELGERDVLDLNRKRLLQKQNSLVSQIVTSGGAV